MDNPETREKTESDIRQLERQFVDDEHKLENIEVDTFDELYNIERRYQSKSLSYLIPRLRNTTHPKHPHTTIKGLLDSIKRKIQWLDEN